MPLAAWPSTIPHEPRESDWGNKPVRDPLVTEFDGGNVRTRFRPGDRVATVKWGRKLLPAEAVAFENFRRDTIADGAARFTMPVCLDGETYENRVVQMVVSSLQKAQDGGRTAVSFSLHVFGASVTA